jgi:proline iminopeptidase
VDVRVDIGSGVRLFVDVVGPHLSPDAEEMRERPVLLVMHGGPGNADHSLGRPYFDRFADTHCVVYFDHRGNGRSDQLRDPSGWNMETWADDVQRLCEALDIELPVLLGTSFGGTVAAHAAARHPGLPSKLVLCSTFVRQDYEATFDAFERIGGASAREAAQRFLLTPSEETALRYREVCRPLYTRRPVVAAPQRVWMNRRVTLHFFQHVAPRLDVTDSMQAVACPTLVLVGDDDPITPPVMSEVIVSSLPPGRARLEVFSDCGHAPWRDQPEKTESVLREFLAA